MQSEQAVSELILVAILVCVVLAVGIAFYHFMMEDEGDQAVATMVLKALEGLGGRATALEIALEVGWSAGPRPTAEITMHLEAMVAEGTCAWEWSAPSPWGERRARKIYVLTPTLAQKAAASMQ